MTILTRRTVRPSDLFDSVFGPMGSYLGAQAAQQAVSSTFGAADIQESEVAYIVSVDTPGAKKEDIEIQVEDGILSVIATVSEEKETKDDAKKYLLRERHSGSFRRSFRLPETVSVDAIGATFADGTTTITLPKSAPQSRAKKIALR